MRYKLLLSWLGLDIHHELQRFFRAPLGDANSSLLCLIGTSLWSCKNPSCTTCVPQTPPFRARLTTSLKAAQDFRPPLMIPLAHPSKLHPFNSILAPCVHIHLPPVLDLYTLCGYNASSSFNWYILQNCTASSSSSSSLRHESNTNSSLYNYYISTPIKTASLQLSAPCVVQIPSFCDDDTTCDQRLYCIAWFQIRDLPLHKKAKQKQYSTSRAPS